MPGIVFILGVYTSVRGSGNLVPALGKKKKSCGGGVCTEWGQAGKKGTAGISQAVGVKGNGQRKEQLTDPGFQVPSVSCPVSDDSHISVRTLLGEEGGSQS